MDKNVKAKSGLATAGMVIGIVAIVGSWIPFLNIISIILGILAFIFGIIPLVKKKSMGKSVTAVVLGVLAVIISISMLVAASKAIDKTINGDTATDSKSTDSEKKRLTLDEGWKIDKSNQFATQVVGTVSNNSDKDISGYIQITFSALDADGANVGDCMANANTVDANGKWKFKAICSGQADEISTVRFKELTGF